MNSLAILTVDNMGVNIIFRQPTCIHGEKTDITLFSPHATLSPQCCVITNHTTFTTCYHQSHQFHHMLSPIIPLSLHVITNHTNFTTCYHQSHHFRYMLSPIIISVFTLQEKVGCQELTIVASSTPSSPDKN